MSFIAVDVATSRMRHAGRDLLSLGLIDARNHTLRWLRVFEDALARRPVRRPDDVTEAPLWLIGHVAWQQEHDIARNVQRQRGPAADASAPRLASIDHEADRRWDPALVPPDERWRIDLPDLAQTRAYLADTMEVTLELLESADETDDALHVFRHALLREDLQCEALARVAQTLGVSLLVADKRLLPDIAPLANRPPLAFPAGSRRIGAVPGGFVFDDEKWAHEVDCPEFEIDSQPVSWAQYAEFAQDGGYDDPRWWSPAGWRWVQATGRRVPRHVEQMRAAVLLQRFGQTTRVPTAQPAMHVSWHEAEAWCRWAGRRLPSEVEWEVAAVAGRARGFRFGDVWEWTASTYRAYPGGPSTTASGKAIRGASFAAHRRLVDPRLRGASEPDRDDRFIGFRSCAL